MAAQRRSRELGGRSKRDMIIDRSRKLATMVRHLTDRNPRFPSGEAAMKEYTPDGELMTVISGFSIKHLMDMMLLGPWVGLV